MKRKVMKDTISKRNWDRMEKDLPLEEEEEKKVPIPEPPVVGGQIKYEDLPLSDIVMIGRSQKANHRNTAGVRFVGYDVTIQLRDKPSMIGWMSEGDYEALRRFLMDRNKAVVV